MSTWPRASEWICGDAAEESVGRIGLISAPLKGASDRCDVAPSAIRAALHQFSTYDIDSQCDLRELTVEDWGALAITESSAEDAAGVIRDGIRRALRETSAVVVLGGSNSIIPPACRALDRASVLLFDSDLRLAETDAGPTAQNTTRALLADGIPGRHVVHIGVQSFVNSPAHADFAADAGIKIISADEVRTRGIDAATATVLDSFITESICAAFDLSVLDRAFAPAAEGSRPGGLNPWELRRAARLCGLHPRVRVFALAGIDPNRDVGDRTALAAAACMLAFASGVHERCSQLLDALSL